MIKEILLYFYYWILSIFNKNICVKPGGRIKFKLSDNEYMEKSLFDFNKTEHYFHNNEVVKIIEYGKINFINPYNLKPIINKIQYFKNGKVHRKDGPALIWIDDSLNSEYSHSEYYLNGEFIYVPTFNSLEDRNRYFKKIVKLKVFR